MKMLLILIIAGLSLSSLAFTSNELLENSIFIGTLNQGAPNSIVLEKNKAKQVTIVVSNIIEWDEDEDEVDEIKKFIPELTFVKRVLRYNGEIIGKRKIVWGGSDAAGSKLFYSEKAHIEVKRERYCSDDFNGDCLSTAYRYHVYLNIVK